VKIPAILLLVFVLFISSFPIFSRSATGQEGGPVISDISVSTSGDSATITWTTDVPAESDVDWGTNPDDNDFTTGNDHTFVTSHSVTISSLLPSTVYYIKIFNRNEAGYETISDIQSFTSASQNPTATEAPATSTTTTTTASTTTTTTKKVVDTTAPSLSLTTNLSHPYVKAPILTGSATDEIDVSSVEYSTDGGANWIAASLEGKGTKSATFNFSLGVLDDGNYPFQIRAKDSAGNTSETKSYTLIIDRLPPQVGGVVFSLGPQTFAPTKDGTLVTVAGLEQKLTLSAIGGPTSLEVSAGDNKFSLTKNIESGLWSGLIKFDSPGVYDLTTKSIDGAKNETDQVLVKIEVLQAGSVSYSGKSINGAEVLVYIFEPTLGEFIVWDGASYSQSNPQKTGENGNYSLLLPFGKYYLEVKISRIIKLRSQIFEITNPSVINADFESGTLSLPFITKEVKVTPTKGFTEVPIENGLVGRDFPFELVESAKGKRLISFVATWLPDTAQQIQMLEVVADDTKNIVIVPQESAATVEIYRKRGGYTLEMFSDPDGKLVEPLRLRFLPVHFFLDEGGKISKIKYGILSLEQ